MADGKREAPTGAPECARAREALAQGDHRLARALAQQVLSDPAAPQAAKTEARAIDQATRIDRGAIVTGLVILVVLLLLFLFVYHQSRAH